MPEKKYEVKSRTFINVIRECRKDPDAPDLWVWYVHPGKFYHSDWQTGIERYVDLGRDRGEINEFRARLSKHLLFKEHDKLARDIWREVLREAPGTTHEGRAR